MKYDICIIGSGAGAGPIAYELSRAGKKVVILEKGDIYTEKDFSKDEIAYTKRTIFTPKLSEEYHTIESLEEGKWIKTPTYESGWSFWNGSMLGGSSNFMSGFFHRLKPDDFKLKSMYGAFEGANVEDWPITYAELEPFYDLVEKVVGVSGEVTPYAHQEERSSPNFPYPPLLEHPLVFAIDATCKELGFTSFKTPRAIISEPKENRNPCYYSHYCGSYACSSGAKGSSRAALIQPALATNNLHIIPNAFVIKLTTDVNKNIKSAVYLTKNGTKKTVDAKVFVLAAQAVESVRLLLNSHSKDFPKGLSNSSGEVGKNMLFSGGGIGSGEFDLSHLPKEELMQPGLFINRSLMDWYFTPSFKGGVVDFLFEHANPIRRANSLKRKDGNLLWGKALQDKVFETFTTKRTLNFEIFTDWMPNDDCFVSIDEAYKDKYGIPVANIRIGAHPQDVIIGEFLAQKVLSVVEKMGAKNINYNISPLPSQNLQAGGCRFGNDPKKHVLNPYCQSYDVPNLFVTDGSFMPTGGSVPYTWTIYANAFRVAHYIRDNFNKWE